jgi:hypothetical protein
MQGVDDGVEYAGTTVAPSGSVQRHREFAVAAPIHGLERLDELEDIGAVLQPCGDDVSERGSKPASTMAKQFGEQLLAIAEVMGDAGVGHPDPRCHRAHLYSGDASLGQQRSRGVEDQPTGFIR